MNPPPMRADISNNGWFRRWWPAGIHVITGLFAARILYGAYCGFTSGEFALFDYGVYTNTVWNLGHGNGFSFLLHKNYLATHLSFSLALLGPLFRIWDHPFLLALAQWLMALGGGAVICRAALKADIGRAPTAALLFLFIAHPFNQQVQLCSFHGVGLYYLLIPWLYYTLVFNRRWCWVPWLLLLGVREDAFIIVLPMVLYFAVRDRWRPGYVMTLLSVGYGIVAIFLLYPAINGVSLFERRSDEISGLTGLFGAPGSLTLRLRSLWWIFLPLAPLVGRRLLPVLIFMSTALLQTMLSSFAKQYGLSNHYPAPIMVTMALGLLEMWRQQRQDSEATSPVQGPCGDVRRAGAIILLTLVSHAFLGYFWGGGHRTWHAFHTVSPKGVALVEASQSLPREGLLVVDNKTAAFVANRDKLTVWDDYQHGKAPLDLVLIPLHRIHIPLEGDLTNQVARGDLGVRYNDGFFVGLDRHYTNSANAALLEMLDHHYTKVAVTRARGGRDIHDPSGTIVRYWEGDGSRAPITLSYGWRIPLNAGPYVAQLRYRAATPEREVRGHWGTVAVFESSGHTRIEERPIPQESTKGQYETLEIPFTVTAPQSVELHITGADARLWLDAVTIRPGE